jgi:hypothetical protein
MFGGLNRLLSATIVAGAVLAAISVGPASAASCGSGTSAANVYKECLQNGGGGKSGGKSSTPTTGAHSSTGSSSEPQHFSSQTQKALNEAGNDKAALAALVKSAGLRRHLAGVDTSTTTPTAVGSAFDLSSGPTALLIVLAGSAFLLLGASGMRVWRSRRRA